MKKLIFLLSLFVSSYVACQTVSEWITTGDKSALLSRQTDRNFETSDNVTDVTVNLASSVEYQTVDGFGFCMTEGSAESISILSQDKQNELLTELFDKSNGLGISVLRISIGASDLSSSDYSYDETTGDVNMNNFSLVGPDLTYLIPLLKKALQINPEIKILATPWTAPRWMKTNNAWIGGSLKTTYYTAYARYFVKYLDTMKSHGINIWAITPQNEPENPNNEPSMSMTYMEQLTFINDNLGPMLANSGYSGVRIIAFDHNCDNTTYPVFVCNNSSYVDGAAFHLYAGNISAMSTVKTETGKNVYFTEQYTASTGDFSGDLGWHMQNVVIGSLANWSKTVIEWNLSNNSAIGPHTPGGCSTCLGAITVNNSVAYTRNVSYYIIGQISKFVRSGAVRIGQSVSGSNLSAVSVKNVDGTIVVVAYNSKSSSQRLKIVSNGKNVVFAIPENSAATFLWDEKQSAIPPIRYENEVLIHPNPVIRSISLDKCNLTNWRTLCFLSSDGRVVKQLNVSELNLSHEIDVSGFSRGVYIVRFQNDNRVCYSRFIKS